MSYKCTAIGAHVSGVQCSLLPSSDVPPTVALGLCLKLTSQNRENKGLFTFQRLIVTKQYLK